MDSKALMLEKEETDKNAAEAAVEVEAVNVEAEEANAETVEAVEVAEEEKETSDQEATASSDQENQELKEASSSQEEMVSSDQEAQEAEIAEAVEVTAEEAEDPELKVTKLLKPMTITKKRETILEREKRTLAKLESSTILMTDKTVLAEAEVDPKKEATERATGVMRSLLTKRKEKVMMKKSKKLPKVRLQLKDRRVILHQRDQKEPKDPKEEEDAEEEAADSPEKRKKRKSSLLMTSQSELSTSTSLRLNSQHLSQLSEQLKDSRRRTSRREMTRRSRSQPLSTNLKLFMFQLQALKVSNMLLSQLPRTTKDMAAKVPEVAAEEAEVTVTVPEEEVVRESTLRARKSSQLSASDRLLPQPGG